MDTQSELDPRNKEAVEAALAGQWEKAVELNNALYEEYPEDITILNRLGHAYTELGQINKARATFKQVLETDPYNPIATRNLEKLSSLRGVDVKPKDIKTIDPEMFLEEPGKTKTIMVTDLAMPKVLITLRTGDTVTLNSTKNDVSVISEDGKRLGKLDSEWGKELAQAINLGSSFSAIVKAVKVGKDPTNSSLSIFCREVKRSTKLAQPIFPIDSNFTPFVRGESLAYLKDQDSLPTETSDGTEEVEMVELPEDTPEISPPNNENIVEDEEDFSP